MTQSNKLYVIICKMPPDDVKGIFLQSLKSGKKKLINTAFSA